MSKKSFVAALVTLLAVPTLTQATPVSYSFTSGTHSAMVTFDIVNSQLQATLVNTSASDVLVPNDVLTAVFFNVSGDPAFSRVSAISGGETYMGVSHVSDSGTIVGGEWAYLNGLSQYGANSGISSSGLGIFGPGDVFPGANLSGPASPDGIQYGIASAGDNQATGNSDITGSELTRNRVTFLLGMVPAGFSLSSIGNVTFQYGTDTAEPSFNGSLVATITSIPEPGTVALFGTGGVLLGLRRRRRAGA